MGPRDLWLNHRPERAAPHPKHRPEGLRVVANPEAAGEDEPIYRRRLERDGWAVRQEWAFSWQDWRRGYVTEAPEERVRTLPHAKGAAPRVILERRIDNLSYRERFWVEGASAAVELPPGPLNWLDWDARGRLVALASGRVWAAEVDPERARVDRFRELLDLSEDSPEDRAPPEEATRW